ncbi:DUF1097 domain-containing protein [Paraglaciecola sp. 2405UD69-4]|uniref:DUF1097 domain-containing protein n=1 Tax=Paraglaciecola sp. 2405UD69-4 TaxID=3391836 RepID=UPI0039C9F3B3
MTRYIHNSILSLGYSKDTLIAAIVAALAAMLTVTFGVAPWVMFIGWIAFFTNPSSFSHGLKSALCVSLGVILGAVAHLCIGPLSSYIGSASLGLVVFVVAIIVITLRDVPVINNIVAWFLGLVTFFAIHVEASISVILQLVITVIFGTLAGFLASLLQQKLLISKENY